MAKSLLQLFNKYEPSGYRREWMTEGEVLSVRADKDQRLLEVKASLKRLVDKEELYLAEADLKAAYDLNFVKILPSYPSSFLTSDYIPQIFREAGNFRVEVRCFFDGCTYILTENSLSVTVRFPERSVQFIQNSNTPHLIKGIIKSEFDKDVEVTIFPSEEDASPDTFFGEDYFAELQRLDSQLSVASRDYEKRAAAANSPEKDAPYISPSEPR